jgi:hypothetical protein
MRMPLKFGASKRKGKLELTIRQLQIQFHGHAFAQPLPRLFNPAIQ